MVYAGVATGVPAFAGFPAGVNFGSSDRTFDLDAAASGNPAFVAANAGALFGAIAALFDGLKNGLAYANIHTMDFRAGKIRANLAIIPIPGAAALFTASLAGLMTCRRRFRPRACGRPSRCSKADEDFIRRVSAPACRGASVLLKDSAVR
jgi:hypothetical protein